MTSRELLAQVDSMEATALAMDMLERSAHDTTRDVRAKARVLVAQAMAMPDDGTSAGCRTGVPGEPDVYPMVIFDVEVCAMAADDGRHPLSGVIAWTLIALVVLFVDAARELTGRKDGEP